MSLTEPWQIAEVATCGLLGILCLLLSAFYFRVRSTELPYMEAFLLGFLIRICLVFINEQYLFLEHKIAGDRSVEFYQKLLSGDLSFMGVLRDTFALQVIVNIPFFSIFDADLMTLLITNSWFSALTGPLVALMLFQPFGKSIARRALLLFFCHPAAVNFSLFGLRDPLIYFFLAIMACTSMSVFAGFNRRVNVVLGLLSGFCVLTLRPELVFVIVALIGMLMLPLLIKTINSDQRLIEKFATAGMLFAMAATISLALALLSLKIVALQTGASTINPLDFAGIKAEERFARAEADGAGGGSHLVAEIDTYRNMPLHIRVPMQTIGLIVLPYPWLITGLTHVFAFADSLFLMILMAINLRISWNNRKCSTLVWALLVAFCIGILGMGLIVSNAGNGFRMRFVIVPLVLLGGAFSRSIPVLRLRRDELADR